MTNLAVQYIIPVSVIVGVILAAITICCVCYRRWRFIQRLRLARTLTPENIVMTSDSENPERYSRKKKDGGSEVSSSSGQESESNRDGPSVIKEEQGESESNDNDSSQSSNA